MTNLDSLKVESYIEDRIPNDHPGGDLPWQVYHTVRNAIVRASRPHGTTGPMGELKIIPGAITDLYSRVAKEPGFWEKGDPHPTYWIVDDQYNHERYCYAELTRPEAFTADWLLSIAGVLREHEGWGLGIVNIPLSYVIIFGTRLMVTGRLARCKSASKVIEKVQSLLELPARD